jgi:hypothetical protein
MAAQRSNIQLGEQPSDVKHAINAWNLMGCLIDWAALPLVAEMLGIEDVETFVHQLVAIRNKQAAKEK